MNIQRELYCPLSPLELSERSEELARLVQKQGEVEAEKKAAMSGFADQLNKLLMDTRVFARVVAEKRERRMVECKYETDYDRGVRSLFRLDTGETVEERPLTPEERQLALKEVANEAGN